MKTIEQRAGEYAHETEVKNGFDMHPKTTSFQGYYQGFSDCQQEYEEKLRWIPVEEKIPEFNDSEYPNGNFEEYEVRFCTGGMSPKYFIRISHLINKTKFSGEFDWTHATHWRPIEYK